MYFNERRIIIVFMEENQQVNSAREIYQQKKESKEIARQFMARGRSGKRVVRWLVFIIGLGLLVWLMIKLGNNGEPIGPIILSSDILAGEWNRGPEGAPLTLIEYGDFQCPACGAYYPTVKQLKKEFGENLRVVFRHFPLRNIHDNANASAYAAEAAGKQGKFWEMHDLVFEKQKEWSGLKNSEVKFIEYAGLLNLDINRFKTDFDSDEIKEKIDKVYDAANRAGINSTPTFILNGKKVQPKGYDEFKSILNQELAK